MKKIWLIVMLLLTVTGIAAAEELTYGEYRFVLLEDGTAQITGYNGSDEKLVIPSKLNDYTVSSIGERAFYGCTSLSSVTIEEGVAVISDFAFESCSDLIDISIPDSVWSVGRNPFVDCEQLRYIVVSYKHPTLSVLSGVLFSKMDMRLICYPGAYQMACYPVPMGTKIIGDLAFYGCRNLKEILIPESVLEIGQSAFESCSALEKVVLPAGLRAVAPRTFAWCSSLKEIVLPETVADVGAEAFLFCRNLMRVTLPDDVQSIGEDAFTWCPKVQIAVQPGTVAAQWASSQGLKVTGK